MLGWVRLIHAKLSSIAQAFYTMEIGSCVSWGVLCLWLCCSLAACINISVDPANDVTLALNDPANVTYNCSIDGGIAAWRIQGNQPEPGNPDFENIGVFIVQPVDTVITLTITQQARMTFFPEFPAISIRCTAFDFENPQSTLGEIYMVRSFDVPSPPVMLDLTPTSSDELIFSWSAPDNTLSGVATTYTAQVSGPRININYTTANTSVTIPNMRDGECEMHTFSVSASNSAGNGNAASMVETIPITPDISLLDEGFEVLSISVSSPAVRVSFPIARTCDTTSFPVVNYTVTATRAGSNISPSTSFDADNTTAMILTPSVSGLELNQFYQVTVTTCVSIACRDSQSLNFTTADVQAAAITFFETNVFITCTFTADSESEGCRIRLVLANDMETLFLPRDRATGVSTQCNQTSSQGNAYISSIAVGVATDGTVGSLPLDIEPMIIQQEAMYTDTTGCSIPDPGLGAGAIAGIIIGIIAFCIIAVAIAVVVGVVVYKWRTGKWFRVRHRDAEKLTVVFEKEWLMGDDKPRRTGSLTRKAKVTTSPGHSTPDGGGDKNEGGATPLESLPSTGGYKKQPSENWDSDNSVINPQSAFTLDISSDRKKVRLHLNRALIRRVLHDKRLTTIDRRKIKLNKTSAALAQHLLPLHCEVRVEADEDTDGANDDGEADNMIAQL